MPKQIFKTNHPPKNYYRKLVQEVQPVSEAEECPFFEHISQNTLKLKQLPHLHSR